jgi:hypothetical protein
MVTKDARFTRQIKSRTVMTKACKKENNLFTIRLDLNLGKMVAKYYVCSVDLHNAETWTLSKAVQIPRKFRNMVLKKNGDQLDR